MSCVLYSRKMHTYAYRDDPKPYGGDLTNRNPFAKYKTANKIDLYRTFHFNSSWAYMQRWLYLQFMLLFSFFFFTLQGLGNCYFNLKCSGWSIVTVHLKLPVEHIVDLWPERININGLLLYNLPNKQTSCGRRLIQQMNCKRGIYPSHRLYPSLFISIPSRGRALLHCSNAYWHIKMHICIHDGWWWWLMKKKRTSLD